MVGIFSEYRLMVWILKVFIAFIYTFYGHSMLSYEKFGQTDFGLRKITA